MLWIPVVPGLSILLAANSALSIFAATAQECLGKKLFIDSTASTFFVLLQGWGWVVVFIFST